MSAQGNALGIQAKKNEAPKWAVLIPHISFIQFNVVAFAQGTELILESDLLVIFFLIGDVFLYLLGILFTDRKRSVAGLPCEVCGIP